MAYRLVNGGVNASVRVFVLVCIRAVHVRPGVYCTEGEVDRVTFMMTEHSLGPGSVLNYG